MDHKNVPAEQSDDQRQIELAQLYKAKKRPLCHCRVPALEMYIAKIGERYIVKRMPNTGPLHAQDCDSFEPPPELSGLGEVLGSAIQENADDGLTELKLAFSMSRMPKRGPQSRSEVESDSVKTDGNKLTIRSILHYLWDQAGFNRWAPAMAGKRNWYVIRKHLLLSAQNKMVKGVRLSERLYIPETFSADKKDAINQHRAALVAKNCSPRAGQQQFMMLIGEVKEILPSRYGHKIVVKHAPDYPFRLNEDIHERLTGRFSTELDLWDAYDATRLLIVATFNAANGVAAVEEAALMLVTENWVPIENATEKSLLDELTKQNRKFVKGLRYNLQQAKPLASVVLSDTDQRPTAMYVIPADATADYKAELDALIEDSLLASWIWDMIEYEIPEIPPRSNHEKSKE